MAWGIMKGEEAFGLFEHVSLKNERATREKGLRSLIERDGEREWERKMCIVAGYQRRDYQQRRRSRSADYLPLPRFVLAHLTYSEL